MSKPFSPIAAGMTGNVLDGFSIETSWGGFLRLTPHGDTWDLTVEDGYDLTIYIPASFDHNTVVALLRANGADIPEASDE